MSPSASSPRGPASSTAAAEWLREEMVRVDYYFSTRGLARSGRLDDGILVYGGGAVVTVVIWDGDGWGGSYAWDELGNCLAAGREALWLIPNRRKVVHL